MDDIEIFGNSEKGKNLIQKIEKNHFLFSFVISYTETCEIPGITIAGADQEAIKYTPAADAEFLHYGFCKSIDKIPMTPDGKPTPAILTKFFKITFINFSKFFCYLCDWFFYLLAIK